MTNYIPKYNYVKLEATDNEGFVYIDDLTIYTGPYIKLSNGKMYAGSSPNTIDGQIFILNDKFPNISVTKRSRIYGALRKDKKKFLSNVISISSTKNIPTKKDYEIGFYNRYFAKRENDVTDYREIDEETYKSIIESKSKYDHKLYLADFIVWSLKGNVFKTNPLNIKILQQKYPHINQLFPIPNEFHRPDLVTISNLSTEGNELYYNDGSEYIGLYHIHPTMGPMEGATHTEESHKRLYYMSQLPKIGGNDYEDFLNSYLQTNSPGCTQNESCASGYHWVGEPICGCTPLESEHHSSEGETQGETSTTTTSTSTTSTTTTGPSSPSAGGGGY